MKNKTFQPRSKETHKESLIKFVLLVLVVASYFGYLVYEYGVASGGTVLALTWSFFVLCTPVADAGFLLDFPVRLLFGWRMIKSEIVVWGLAFVINTYIAMFNVKAYDTTFITSLLYKIISTPYPYWSIIFLCGLGTFLSIYFGDEMFDVIQHKDCEKSHRHGFKYKVIATIALFALIIFAYYHLLETLGIKIDI